MIDKQIEKNIAQDKLATEVRDRLDAIVERYLEELALGAIQHSTLGAVQNLSLYLIACKRTMDVEGGMYIDSMNDLIDAIRGRGRGNET